MSKQPSRQRCQPKIYTDSDFRKALREAVFNVGCQNMKISIASFALALHRKLGLNSDQIVDILTATNEYSLNALCFQDVRKELIDETGLDLDEFVDSI